MTRVKGDPSHPANFGDVCAKAVHLPPVLRTGDRLCFPQVRSRRDAPLERVPWDLALRVTAERIREILAAHGPDAVAFYASGQLLTEEYYVAAKLAKGFLRTNNFDTNSRLCMASAAAGYARSLGSDGPPAAYADIEEGRLLLPDRHQHRRLPSHHLQAHPPAEARPPRRGLRRGRGSALDGDRRPG